MNYKLPTGECGPVSDCMSERYENTETGIFGQNDSIGFKEIEQTSIFQQQTLLQPLGRERLLIVVLRAPPLDPPSDPVDRIGIRPREAPCYLRL